MRNKYAIPIFTLIQYRFYSVFQPSKDTHRRERRHIWVGVTVQVVVTREGGAWFVSKYAAAAYIPAPAFRKVSESFHRTVGSLLNSYQFMKMRAPILPA